MPLGQWNLEFLAHNAQRHYPLTDEATGTDQTGSFTIPEDFLVELDLPIHAAIDALPGAFFIRLLGAFPTGYSITVAYETDIGYVDVATALIPRVNFSRNTTFALGGIEPFDDTMGKVVIGRLDGIDEKPSGLWEFLPDATRIEPDCIRPIIRGIQALIVVNGTQRSPPITGDVEIQAGDNMQIVPILVEGEDPIIRFNAIEGEGLVKTCVCEGEEAESPCIREINGVAPTADGKLNIIGDKCLTVTASANSLRIEDKCCQPCCGCPELEAITRDLERFNTERVTYEAMISDLEASGNAMNLTVLGARLGDRGCITCE